MTGDHETFISMYTEGRQVAQSGERRALDIKVRGSKLALGTGGGVGSYLSSPIGRDAMSWMTKTVETDTDNRQLTTVRFWIAEPWIGKIGRFPKRLHILKQKLYKQ